MKYKIKINIVSAASSTDINKINNVCYDCKVLVSRKDSAKYIVARREASTFTEAVYLLKLHVYKLTGVKLASTAESLL